MSVFDQKPLANSTFKTLYQRYRRVLCQYSFYENKNSLRKKHWQTVHLKRFANVTEECFANTHFTKIKHWQTYF